MRRSTFFLVTFGTLLIAGSAILQTSLTRPKAHAMPPAYVCPDSLLEEPGRDAEIVRARPPG
jgi:hypothetical protein